MARIHQTIESSKSALEMRLLIDGKVLNRPEVALLLTEHRWEGNVLHARGKLGHGTITVADNLVTIDIELSMFGAAAKGAIEQTLTEKIKMLK
ncbi:MAG: hypothetical protein FGM33_06185 [Candidatus Kapabacteria bacterium]|nr:hypothetical protein [Candidatus Kapabacteria bacterium]